MAVALATVLAVEIVAVPLAEASQYETLWSKRQEKTTATHDNRLASLPRFLGEAPVAPRHFSKELSIAPRVFSPANHETKVFSGPLSHLLNSVTPGAAIVRDVHVAPASQTAPVLLIQDVHLNPEAQGNIASVLRAVLEAGTADVVGVEGAFQKFDFSSFRLFNKDVMRDVAGSFLEAGHIGAASYTGMTLDRSLPPFIGVDDEAAHAANVAAYRDTLSLVPGMELRIDRQETSLLEKMGRDLSPAAVEFHSIRTAFHRGKLGLGEYLKKISGGHEEIELGVERFLMAYELELKLDFARVEAERKSIIEKLVATLSEAELNELLERSTAYRLGQLSYGDYFSNLRELCERKGISLASVPAFSDYIRYVLLSDAVEVDDLYRAIDRLEESATARLAPTETESALLRTGEFLTLARKLIRFELTPSEWDAYRRLASVKIPDLALSSFERFYEMASRRSEIIVEKLLAADSKKGRVLICGGFHSPELSVLLRRRNVSYAVIAPRITKITNEAGSSYLSVFSREKTPLDRLFAGDTLFVNPSETTPGSGARASLPTAGAILAFTAAVTASLGLGLPAGFDVALTAQDLYTVGFAMAGVSVVLYIVLGASPKGRFDVQTRMGGASAEHPAPSSLARLGSMVSYVQKLADPLLVLPWAFARRLVFVTVFLGAFLVSMLAFGQDPKTFDHRDAFRRGEITIREFLDYERKLFPEKDSRETSYRLAHPQILIEQEYKRRFGTLPLTVDISPVEVRRDMGEVEWFAPVYEMLERSTETRGWERAEWRFFSPNVVIKAGQPVEVRLKTEFPTSGVARYRIIWVDADGNAAMVETSSARTVMSVPVNATHVAVASQSGPPGTFVNVPEMSIFPVGAEYKGPVANAAPITGVAPVQPPALLPQPVPVQDPPEDSSPILPDVTPEQPAPSADEQAAEADPRPASPRDWFVQTDLVLWVIGILSTVIAWRIWNARRREQRKIAPSQTASPEAAVAAGTPPAGSVASADAAATASTPAQRITSPTLLLPFVTLFVIFPLLYAYALPWLYNAWSELMPASGMGLAASTVGTIAWLIYLTSNVSLVLTAVVIAARIFIVPGGIDSSQQPTRGPPADGAAAEVGPKRWFGHVTHLFTGFLHTLYSFGFEPSDRLYLLHRFKAAAVDRSAAARVQALGVAFEKLSWTESTFMLVPVLLQPLLLGFFVTASILVRRLKLRIYSTISRFILIQALTWGSVALAMYMGWGDQVRVDGLSDFMQFNFLSVPDYLGYSGWGKWAAGVMAGGGVSAALVRLFSAFAILNSYTLKYVLLSNTLEYQNAKTRWARLREQRNISRVWVVPFILGSSLLAIFRTVLLVNLFRRVEVKRWDGSRVRRPILWVSFTSLFRPDGIHFVDVEIEAAKSLAHVNETLRHFVDLIESHHGVLGAGENFLDRALRPLGIDPDEILRLSAGGMTDNDYAAYGQLSDSRHELEHRLKETQTQMTRLLDGSFGDNQAWARIFRDEALHIRIEHQRLADQVVVGPREAAAQKAGLDALRAQIGRFETAATAAEKGQYDPSTITAFLDVQRSLETRLNSTRQQLDEMLMRADIRAEARADVVAPVAARLSEASLVQVVGGGSGGGEKMITPAVVRAVALQGGDPEDDRDRSNLEMALERVGREQSERSRLLAQRTSLESDANDLRLEEARIQERLARIARARKERDDQRIDQMFTPRELSDRGIVLPPLLGADGPGYLFKESADGWVPAMLTEQQWDVFMDEQLTTIEPGLPSDIEFILAPFDRHKASLQRRLDDLDPVRYRAYIDLMKGMGVITYPGQDNKTSYVPLRRQDFDPSNIQSGESGLDFLDFTRTPYLRELSQNIRDPKNHFEIDLGMEGLNLYRQSILDAQQDKRLNGVDLNDGIGLMFRGEQMFRLDPLSLKNVFRDETDDNVLFYRDGADVRPMALTLQGRGLFEEYERLLDLRTGALAQLEQEEKDRAEMTARLETIKIEQVEGQRQLEQLNGRIQAIDQNIAVFRGLVLGLMPAQMDDAVSGAEQREARADLLQEKLAGHRTINELLLSNRGDPEVAGVSFLYDFFLGVAELMSRQDNAGAQTLRIAADLVTHSRLGASITAPRPGTGEPFESYVKNGELLMHANQTRFLLAKAVAPGSAATESEKNELYSRARGEYEYVRDQQEGNGRVPFGPQGPGQVFPDGRPFHEEDTAEFQITFARAAFDWFSLEGNPDDRDRAERAVDYLVNEFYDPVAKVFRIREVHADGRTSSREFQEIAGLAIASGLAQELEERGVDISELASELVIIPTLPGLTQPSFKSDWLGIRIVALPVLADYLRDTNKPELATQVDGAFEQLRGFYLSLPLQPAWEGGGMADAYVLKDGVAAARMFEADEYVALENVDLGFGWESQSGSNTTGELMALLMQRGYNPFRGEINGSPIDWAALRPAAQTLERVAVPKNPLSRTSGELSGAYGQAVFDFIRAENRAIAAQATARATDMTFHGPEPFKPGELDSRLIGRDLSANIQASRILRSAMGKSVTNVHRSTEEEIRSVFNRALSSREFARATAVRDMILMDEAMPLLDRFLAGETLEDAEIRSLNRAMLQRLFRVKYDYFIINPDRDYEVTRFHTLEEMEAAAEKLGFLMQTPQRADLVEKGIPARLRDPEQARTRLIVGKYSDVDHPYVLTDPQTNEVIGIPTWSELGERTGIDEQFLDQNPDIPMYRLAYKARPASGRFNFGRLTNRDAYLTGIIGHEIDENGDVFIWSLTPGSDDQGSIVDVRTIESIEPGQPFSAFYQEGDYADRLFINSPRPFRLGARALRTQEWESFRPLGRYGSRSLAREPYGRIRGAVVAPDFSEVHNPASLVPGYDPAAMFAVVGDEHYFLRDPLGAEGDRANPYDFFSDEFQERVVALKEKVRATTEEVKAATTDEDRKAAIARHQELVRDLRLLTGRMMWKDDLNPTTRPAMNDNYQAHLRQVEAVLADAERELSESQDPNDRARLTRNVDVARMNVQVYRSYRQFVYQLVPGLLEARFRLARMEEAARIPADNRLAPSVDEDLENEIYTGSQRPPRAVPLTERYRLYGNLFVADPSSLFTERDITAELIREQLQQQRPVDTLLQSVIPRVSPLAISREQAATALNRMMVLPDLYQRVNAQDVFDALEDEVPGLPLRSELYALLEKARDNELDPISLRTLNRAVLALLYPNSTNNARSAQDSLSRTWITVDNNQGKNLHVEVLDSTEGRMRLYGAKINGVPMDEVTTQVLPTDLITADRIVVEQWDDLGNKRGEYAFAWGGEAGLPIDLFLPDPEGKPIVRSVAELNAMDLPRADSLPAPPGPEQPLDRTETTSGNIRTVRTTQADGQERVDKYHLATPEEPYVYLMERSIGDTRTVNSDPFLNPASAEIIPGTVRVYYKDQLVEVREVQRSADGIPQFDYQGGVRYVISEPKDPAFFRHLPDFAQRIVRSFLSGIELKLEAVRIEGTTADGFVFYKEEIGSGEAVWMDVARERDIYSRTLQLVDVPARAVDTATGATTVHYDVVHDDLSDGVLTNMTVTAVNTRATYEGSLNSAALPDSVQRVTRAHDISGMNGRLPLWEVRRMSFKGAGRIDVWGRPAPPLDVDEVETPAGVEVHAYQTIEEVGVHRVKEIGRVLYAKTVNGEFLILDEERRLTQTQNQAPVPTQPGVRRFTLGVTEQGTMRVEGDLARAVWAVRGRNLGEGPSMETGLLRVHVETRAEVTDPARPENVVPGEIQHQDRRGRAIETESFLTGDSAETARGNMRSRVSSFVRDPILQRWVADETTTWQGAQLAERRFTAFIDPTTGDIYQDVVRFELNPDRSAFSALFSQKPREVQRVSETRTWDNFVAYERDPSKGIEIENNLAAARDIWRRGGERHAFPDTAYVWDVTTGRRGPAIMDFTSEPTVSESRVTALMVDRRSMGPKNLWEEQVFERAPFHYQDPFGRYAGVLRQRLSTKGVVENGTGVARRGEQIFYEDDVLNPNVSADAAESIAYLAELHKRSDSGHAELGRILRLVGEDDRTLIVMSSVGQGVEQVQVDGESRALLRVRIDTPGYFPVTHWMDAQGRDLTSHVLIGNTVNDEITFDLARYEWKVDAAHLLEERPAGFEPNTQADPETLDRLHTLDIRRRGTVPARNFYGDAPADAELYAYRESPTTLVGDPSAQTVTSYYDDLGFLWAQTEITGEPLSARRTTYFPNLGLRTFTDAEAGQVLWSSDDVNPSHSDFLMFFAEGQAKGWQKGVKIEVRSPNASGGESVLYVHDGPADANTMSFWHPDFSDPLVGIPAGVNDEKFSRRFMSVRPMDGNAPLFDTGANARAFILPIAELRARGIDASRMTVRVVEAPGIRITPAERLGDVEINAEEWDLSEKERRNFFPAGEAYERIPAREPRVIDNGNGIVTVVRGSGTAEQTFVYDHGVLSSLTYWLRNGTEYDLVRMNFVPAVSSALRIPQYAESGFGGWLGRMITTRQAAAGRYQVNTANVDKSVFVSMLPTNMENFNSPVVNFAPFGLYDPNATFPSLNANPINAALRFANPDLEQSFRGFDQKLLVSPQRLDPIEMKEAVEASYLNVPISAMTRELPVAAPPDPNAVAPSVEEWVRSIEESMNRNTATGLPDTHPETLRAAYVDTQDAAEIMIGLIDAGRVDLARRMAEFYRRATQNGERPALSGFQRDYGAAHQFTHEWRLPGAAIPTSGATIRLARAMIRLAQATGDPEDRAMAIALTQRTLEFMPDNDYFWPKANPTRESLSEVRSLLDHVPGIDFLWPTEGEFESRADRLLQSWERLRSERLGAQEKKTDEVDSDIQKARVANILMAAAEAIRANPSDTIAIRERFSLQLTNLLASSPHEADMLNELLRATGGVSEYLPRTPLVNSELGFALSPEPDDFRLTTNSDALQLFGEAQALLQGNSDPTSIEQALLVRATMAEKSLAYWFQTTVFPTVEKSRGLAPAHWRQQLWITGVTPTGQEGREQPYVFLAARWATLESLLAAIEARMAIDVSDEGKDVARAWLATALRVYGGRRTLDDGRVVSGLDPAPETLGRYEGQIFESELTARFGVLARRAEFEEGIAFAEASLSTLADTETPGLLAVAAGVDPSEIHPTRGLVTGDDRVMYPAVGGERYGWSPMGSLNAIQLMTGPISGEAVEAGAATPPNGFERRLRDLLGSDAFIYGALVTVGVNGVVWVFSVVWNWVSSFRNLDPSTWFAAKPPMWLRIIRDIALVPLLFLPVLGIAWFMGISGQSVVIAIVWLFPVAKLINAEISALRYQRYIASRKKIEKEIGLLNQQDHLLSEDTLQASFDRYYRRVIGNFQIRDAQGHETPAIGASIPSEARPGEHVGTAETQFLVGLQHIYTWAFEYYRRQNPEWNEEILSGSGLPTMDQSNFPLRDGDVDSLWQLDRFARRTGEWFRRHLDRDEADSRIFAHAELYLSDQAEELRRLLSDTVMKKHAIGDELTEEEEARRQEINRQFEENLLNLGVGFESNVTDHGPDDVTDMKNQFVAFELRMNKNMGQFIRDNNLVSINPYWFEVADFGPQVALFIVAFAFIYARQALSPVELFTNNILFLSTMEAMAGLSVFQIGAILIAIGALGLFLSVIIFRPGDFKPTLPLWARVQKSLFRSDSVRFTVAGLLVLGIAGVIILTPGFPSSMTLVGMLIPMMVVAILGLEVLALLTNRISIVRLAFRHHFGRPSHVGSARIVALTMLQFLIFISFSIWLTDQVASFFEGSLVSQWGWSFSSLLRPDLSIPAHVAVVLAVSLAFYLFLVQLKKIRQPKLSVVPLAELLGKVPVRVAAAVMLAVALLSLDLWRPGGGFIVGGLILLVSLALSNYAIYGLMVGVTSVARETGSPRNLFLELPLGMAVFAVLGWALPMYGIALPFISPLLFQMAFFGLVILWLASAGDPAFAPYILAAAVTGFVLPDLELAPLFRIAVLGLSLVSIGFRVKEAIRFRLYQKWLREFDLDTIPDHSLGQLITGGQPMASPALSNTVQAAVNQYMGFYDKVIAPNFVPSSQWLLDESGEPRDRSYVEAGFTRLFTMEREKGMSLLGEEAVVVRGRPLTETQERLARLVLPSGETGSALFYVDSDEEADELRFGWRMQRYLVTKGPIAGSQRDTLFFVLQMAKTAAARGLGKKMVIYIQSNKFSGKRADGSPDPENNERDPGPRVILDYPAKEVELRERMMVAAYIEAVTGVTAELATKEEMEDATGVELTVEGMPAEVVHNHSFAGMKSAAQGGNSGSFRNIRAFHILDRNAQSPTVRLATEDQMRALAHPNLISIFPQRTTSNKMFTVGYISDLNEFGFSIHHRSVIENLGGRSGRIGSQGDLISIGWGNNANLPFNRLIRAYADPTVPYRFRPKTIADWAFGPYHGSMNFPHVSEDYVQAQMNGEAVKGLGEEWWMGVSWAFYYKLREHSEYAEFLAARPRWGGGGDSGQKGVDPMVQRLREMGSDSVHQKVMQRNRGRYYILYPLAMFSIIITPILIVTGYTPFAGILVLFWTIGIMANQVLTLNGAGAFINRAGFWAGITFWILNRYLDFLRFAALVFIEFYGVMEAIVKGVRYAFIFILSGGARMEEYPANPAPAVLGNAQAAHVYRWMFATGFVTTIANLIVITRLDPLNVIMLYPTLVFTTGWMLAPFVFQHMRRPGDAPFFQDLQASSSRFRSAMRKLPQTLLLLISAWVIFSPLRLIRNAPGLFLRVLPVLLGIVWSVVSLTLISVGTSTLLFPVPNYVFLVIGLAMFFVVFPGRFVLVLPTAEEKAARSAPFHQKRLHNLMIIGFWLLLTLAIGAFFGWSYGSLLMGTGTVVVPLIKLTDIVLELRGVPSASLPSVQFRATLLKDLRRSFPRLGSYPDWALELARRTVMIVAGSALLWFIIVSSPALMSARILHYNLTLNYLQVTLFAANVGALVLVAVILGGISYFLTWFIADMKYARLWKAYGHRLRANSINPAVSGAIEALRMGFEVERDSQGPVKALGYLKEMERALRAGGGRDYLGLPKRPTAPRSGGNDTPPSTPDTNDGSTEISPDLAVLAAGMEKRQSVQATLNAMEVQPVGLRDYGRMRLSPDMPQRHPVLWRELIQGMYLSRSGLVPVSPAVVATPDQANGVVKILYVPAATQATQIEAEVRALIAPFGRQKNVVVDVLLQPGQQAPSRASFSMPVVFREWPAADDAETLLVTEDGRPVSMARMVVAQGAETPRYFEAFLLILSQTLGRDVAVFMFLLRLAKPQVMELDKTQREEMRKFELLASQA